MFTFFINPMQIRSEENKTKRDFFLLIDYTSYDSFKVKDLSKHARDLPLDHILIDTKCTCFMENKINK